MGNASRSNCFNIIRFLAALQVFLGHAAGHLNVELPQLPMKLLFVVQGVPVFFLISGFLIWTSLNRENNLKAFVRKRILRIYPELWGGVVLSAIVIIVLYSDHIKWNRFIPWIATQSTVLQFWTPDCLRGYGCGTPNGSLWTIGVMVQCYVVMWLLHRFLHGKGIGRWSFILTVGIICNILTPYSGNVMPVIISKLFGQTFVPYIWIFVLGALISEKFESWKSVLTSYWWIFLSVSAIATFTGLDVGSYGTFKVLTLAPAVIGFAYKYPALNVKYDISYGFYIYHMIVINFLIECGYTGKVIYIFMACGLSIILAVVSYFTMGKIYRKQKHK